MQTILWEVDFPSPPETIHHCKKCGGKTEHLPGLFRVNAQQKALDVWLVYRCAKCKSTWNLTILSRVHPKSIDGALLEKFLANDAGLINRYAMDADWLRRNGAETKPAPFRVTGGEVDLSRDARVTITCRYPAKIRLSKILREKLSLSAKDFDCLVARGTLRLEGGGDIARCELQGEAVVIIGGLSACAGAKSAG